MMGSPINCESQHIIPHIPKNSIGAEIGVWMGNSSTRFLKMTQPAHLHLVDPWSKEPYKQQTNSEHNSYDQYLAKYSTVTGSKNEAAYDEFYEKVYRGVVDKFKGKDNVTIHRVWSTEFFDTFEGKLDWIYVDGDHSYEGCYKDLVDCLKVMSPDGIIFGDDYAWRPKNGKPGVTAAVDQFVLENNFNLERLGNREYMIRINNVKTAI